MSSKPSPSPFVSVCVCTYERMHLLTELLQSLLAQHYPASCFEVVVVDNDAQASARSTFQAFADAHPTMTLRYDVEPQQGISHARNRTVALSKGELLAFIDDDEQAAPQWLSDLVASLHREKADAVIGPVLPVYPPTTPAWIVQSRFFERPRFASGTPIDWRDTRTSNALVRGQWARQRRPSPFSVALTHSGGEDTDFFHWLEDQGGRFTWCDTAMVSEEIPTSRQRLSFMLERSMRNSANYWRQMYRSRSTPWRYIHALVGLAGWLPVTALGIVRLPLGLGRAVPLWVRSAKLLGRVVALSDIQFVGYRKQSW